MVPARILVLTQKEMGDLIVITPLLRALKRRFPGHQIWVGSRPLIREVYANNPAVSGFIDVPLSEVKRG
ncbi:MAG: hypothetical protein J0L53_09380, partial [Spirochaetes bacterium]|nr:hypothetical protein [Spirochaetota bacterium]